MCVLLLQYETNTEPLYSLRSLGHSPAVTCLRPYVSPGFSCLKVNLSLVDSEHLQRVDYLICPGYLCLEGVTHLFEIAMSLHYAWYQLEQDS